ncbi:MAG: FAD-binding protein [Candidatus Daviesbacteria bacterium]|nr:MAG: FAD-binding protein [Candidatus Daviesbacteria bacterium]
MDTKLKLIVSSLGQNLFKTDELLSDHTVLKLGGPAKLFFVATNQREIIKVIDYCRQLKIPFLLFGTGSKMAIADRGFEGLVIKNRSQDMKVVSIKGKVSKFGIGVEEALVEADSGVTIGNFVEFLIKQGLKSESFVGLPGSIGGNLFINALLQQAAEKVRILTPSSKIENISPKNLKLGREVILSATFKIKAASD